MADQTDNVRDRILEAAGEIFAERGFDLATVRDICQQAGANVAAVNYYFGDKQRLYVETVVRAHRWRMDQAALPDFPEGTPAEAKLVAFIQTFVRRMLSGGGENWQSRLMMRELTTPNAACAEIVRDSIRPQFNLLCSVLRELLPANTTDEKLHLTAFSVVGQCLFYRIADPVVRNLIEQDEYQKFDADKLSKHIVQFVLASLGRPAVKVSEGVVS